MQLSRMDPYRKTLTKQLELSAASASLQRCQNHCFGKLSNDPEID